MDVREKLFTLFQDCNNPSWKWFPNNAEMLKLVDYLIAHGVTVQEWIPVTERLPDPDQDVILCTLEIETYGKHHEKKKIYRNIYMGYFDGDEWLTSYCHGCEYIFRMNEKYPNETIEVTHWMPLPEPPKGK